jgi:hypothetical protein
MRNYTCFVWTVVFAASIALAGTASAQPPGQGRLAPGQMVGTSRSGASRSTPVGRAPVGQCQSVPDPSVWADRRGALRPDGPPPIAMTIGPMLLDMPPMVMVWSDQDRKIPGPREGGRAARA